MQSGILIAALGFILTILGVLGTFSRRFLEWQIKMSNEIRGVSTKITSGTISVQKFQHMLFLALGISLLFLGAYFCSIFSLACV